MNTHLLESWGALNIAIADKSIWVVLARHCKKRVRLVEKGLPKTSCCVDFSLVVGCGRAWEDQRN